MDKGRGADGQKKGEKNRDIFFLAEFF